MPLCSLLPSGNAVALITHVLIDTTHVRFATVAFNDDAVVCSHTHTPMMSYFSSHQEFWNQSSLHVRVVGDQDACPRPCPSPLSIYPEGFPQSAHNNAEFLQITLDLVLRLIDLVLISGLLCLLHHPINFGLRQFPFHHDTLDDSKSTTQSRNYTCRTSTVF